MVIHRDLSFSQPYYSMFIYGLIRFLYYLPMERMMDNETFDEVLNSFKEADSIVKRLKTRIAELEEENKNLKEELKELKKYSVKLTGMAVTYNSVKEREEKQKEQIEKCKLALLAVNEKLIEEIFGED